jgi:hypothetical protein
MVIIVVGLVAMFWTAVVPMSYGPLLLHRNPLVVCAAALVVLLYSAEVRGRGGGGCSHPFPRGCCCR